MIHEETKTAEIKRFWLYDFFSFFGEVDKINFQSPSTSCTLSALNVLDDHLEYTQGSPL